MPTPDETLAAIDDVIEWHGSADAMVWTAEAPAPRVITPEHIRDVWVDVDITTVDEVHEFSAQHLANWSRRVNPSLGVTTRPTILEEWAVSTPGQRIEDWAREQGLVMQPFQRRYLNAIIQTTRHLRTHASGGEVSPRSPQ